MQRAKYASEFKDEAVKQVVDKGHSGVDVSKSLGIPEGVFIPGSASSRNPKSPSPMTSRHCRLRCQSSRQNSGERPRSATS